MPVEKRTKESALLGNLKAQFNANAEKIQSDAENFFDQKIELTKFTLTGIASLYGLMLAGIVSHIDEIHQLGLIRKSLICVCFVVVSMALVRISYYLANLVLNKFSIVLGNWHRFLNEIKKGIDRLEKLIPDLDESSSSAPLVPSTEKSWSDTLSAEIQEDGGNYKSALAWGTAALFMLNVLITFLVMS